ncbi:uncharacterized protein KIAA1614 homolog [Hyperolius riggenbachi]|uniref:uncharacterized protein KIAA1614 homolog n=1 Tax=Hyperolius riggenbachi TaxID=752182 RepID=UPI0035A3CDF1
MAAEVNTREYVPPRGDMQGLVRSTKSPRSARPAGERGRSTEQVDKSVKWEQEDGMRTTVLQSKVNALKEKYMKERKRESRISECSGGEGDGVEDTVVTPELRTYLTEELLDCSKHGRLSGAHQEAWRDEESWGTYSSNGPSIPHYSDCKMADPSSHSPSTQHSSSVWPQDRLHSSSDSLVGGLQENSDQEIISLTLAERVERNRKELRNKLGKTSSPSGEVSHGCVVSQGQTGRDGSWFMGDGDGELGMSLSVTEDCGELSVRHEQAKQLLQRARMKAKGASPLRASHCVLSHPHSQPNLHRGPIVSGALTDGGSLSDSSSSDYCSWHKGSRGSSPSHVRFQDESEREAEERYRERQQVPQASPVTSTPPSKRQSNGLVSWTEQLPPPGHGQCGACGSYLKGPGTNAAAIHGTNLRSAHLGSKITQDGPVNCPMGVKPSPHWILPSQPWRVHTELIRETHIGGDSTADSSGDDDRNHSKKNGDWGMHKNCRNNTIGTTPKQGARPHPSNTLEREESVTRSLSEKSNESKFGTTNHILEDRMKSNPHLLAPVVKTSQANPEVATTAVGFCVDSVRTGLRVRQQDSGAKHTRKHKATTLEYNSELNPTNQEIGVGNIMLNVDTREVNCRVDSTDCRTLVTPGVPSVPQMISPTGITGHVPVPPSGKAPTMAPSRNRLALRSGGSSQQLNHSLGRDVMEPSHDKKGIQSSPVPNTRNFAPEIVGTLDDHHLSAHGMKSKEHKSREPTQKLRKQAEDKKMREVKEKRDSLKIQMPKEQRDIDRHYTSSKQKDCDRHQSPRDQRDRDSGPTPILREQENNDLNYSKRDEKCFEKSGINGHPACRSNADTGSGKCSRENSFNCQTTGPVILTKDRYLELAEDRLLQPVMKKGDIRSGMRKIFSSIGLTSRPRLERFQSSSLEQISLSDSHGRSSSADGDSESRDGSMNPGKIKKSPSLQSLKLMSPFHLPRKSSSVQNLTGKSDRSAVYITEDVNTTPRRALSVEDIGSPGKARALGKVAQVYSDGTRRLELQRPENGTFGFKISSGDGRPDSGIYVQEMSDANTAKLYSGLLRVGDEILEVNGTKVSTLDKLT